MDAKQIFVQSLYECMDGNLKKERLYSLIEKPKQAKMGDLAFPCFELARNYRKNPQEIATQIVEEINSIYFERVEAVGAYVNVFLNKALFTKKILQQISKEKTNFGYSNLGEEKVITIDLSSPNIAKPFSMGHLRSTVIGNAIANIAEKVGYKTVRINHLGDWGTQFGKLMVAYQKWGNEDQVRANPIKELLQLYIRFHEEAEVDTKLNDIGRKWFKRLEDGDAQAEELWGWFREESLKDFSRIYELLGISFDSYNGEAFYNDKMDRVVHELQQKGLLIESEGAKVVTLEEENLPPCLIQKRDGTTLYATRDLAAAIYRYETYHFAKSLYVVGNEQTLHFTQLSYVLQKMGYNWAKNMKHISFGMMLKEGKKMSTRKGKLVLLEEVLQEAIQLANNNIMEKNPLLEKKEEVARQVGVGAVIFHDLKNDRHNDVEFSLEDMLRFEGETGPYIQYTHARMNSLLKKGGYRETNNVSVVDINEAWPIITRLMALQDTVMKAYNASDPSKIAKYLIELAREFNKYYANVRILGDEENKQARLQLVYSVKTVLKEGLRLLGIQAPDAM
ncbi:arginine--tRNA ligase [Oceanobacillus kimchii]|uniref:arginine--tRNA ligase n=1 Tax=Oceanobacillus kimchii TaxID=746691 RepID=UPI0021A90329|nr:arginine--tRNA ligase [Oceanobacillus kimchii]MCT1578773.1 arginine--tRNA ligase [Oceanobacillus kimchii]MCT2137777.1 arginine--tRNA ligase [Oceanobacillus kimchii]